MEQKKSNIKILVACHKADQAIRQDDIYMPIHVGKALHPEVDLGFQGDNTGDNISEKNGSYCELTAMYWAWKNLPKDVDIVGMCHYRRYFVFNGSRAVKEYSFSNSNSELELRSINLLLSKYKIIIPKKAVCPVNVFAQYSYFHNSEDLRELEKTIERVCPEYLFSFRKVMYRCNKFSPYNMFITDIETFNSYCAWLFPLLRDLEKHINIENYNLTQKRIYGYMAERLLNVYILHNNLKSVERPIGFIGSFKYSRIREILSNIRSNIVFRLTNINSNSSRL